MEPGWLTSAAARRILVHFADSCPAWLWSGDGSRLLWRNTSARLFGAKLKKVGLRLLPDPVPIKGQVARLIRLGATGRSSLSRTQFLAGERPLSQTCTVTPLLIADDKPALLIVGVDPIDVDLRSALGETGPDTLPEALFPAGLSYLVVTPDGRVAGGAQPARDQLSQRIESEGLPEEGARLAEAEVVARLKASPDGHTLLLVASPQAQPRAPLTIDQVRVDEGIGTSEHETEVAAPDDEEAAPAEGEAPSLPVGQPLASEGQATAGEEEEDADSDPDRASLSSLFDRLADTETLYGVLTEDDERFVPPEPTPSEAAKAEGPSAPEAPGEPAALDDGVEEQTTALQPTPPPPDTPASPPPPETDVIAAVIAFENDLDDEPAPLLYRITGRGFTPIDADAESLLPTAELEITEPPPTEAMDRVSRYNFDELGRILADRVSNEASTTEGQPAMEPPTRPSAIAEGALINIAAETFILNRLPLGIMVFRDQQVLFANRALADLLGFPTMDSLRAAGLAAVFPSDDAHAAGPVTHLVHRDGTPFPVTARLQSITWQGRPALMLSASALPPVTGQEGAVRGFAELAAEIMKCGFLTADRSGMILSLSPTGRAMLGAAGEQRLLVALVRTDDAAALREFLERPARFAETTRPAIRLRTVEAGADLILFAEGSAGIVGGYFGLIVASDTSRDTAAPGMETTIDPSMLARISRGVRRPLNTIVGFADLIRSAAFGTIDNHRYLEYARDIRTAGQEIAVLVDELDDYSRLQTGVYPTRPAELDLAAMLESCMVRVRGQAAAARVLVRSAISERLPRIRADRASLGQAVLNLLTSAIDQSPPGSSVILSAQLEEEGHVAVNIRDSGEAAVDPGERFVVFRDGIGKDGEPLTPVRSGVGLALTRALVAVNACALTVSPAGPVGTLFSLTIPADLVEVSATG